MRPTVLRFCCVVFLALLWLAGTPVAAYEVPALNTAPVVVVGKVRKVWVDDSTAAKGYVLHLIEIDVEKVEKAEKVGAGEEPKPGKVLYAWTPFFKDVPGVVAPAGDLPRVKPAEGATVRMYCTIEKDGRYTVLMNAVAIKVLAEPKKE
jgi:hypothetical protein